METQNQIRRKLAQPLVLEGIRALVKVNEVAHRNELAGRLCEELGFFDARGRPQRSSCLKALRELEGRGQIELPAPQHSKRGGWTPRRLGQAVPAAAGVPESAGRVRSLELLEVGSEEQMRIWNELILREHPQGHRPMMGRQIRYLIGSEHGWLGAVGFGAAALGLRARDEWIGWELEERREHLDKVVCMSRFLIRNRLRCRNLASMVLGQAVRRLPEDFERRYGYWPWLLESFVDTDRYAGSCYKAANWIAVGQTQGRGRQDRAGEAPESIKTIYLYPLVKDFRRRLGLGADAGQGPLGVSEGLEPQRWAENEMGAAPLGDRRLSQRLVRIAHAKSQAPASSWLQIIQGDRAAEKGYYRLIDHPDQSMVRMTHMLQTHRDRTLRRMQKHSRVLCVTDITDLNYSTLKECEGLGIIGKNQTGSESKGLRLHSTLAFSESGLPLGVLRADCYAPELKPQHKRKDRRWIPPEQKETFRWIEALKDCMQIAQKLRGSSLLCVMDREADFFELFDRWREHRSVDLLVRAKHDRSAEGEEGLFESIRRTAVRTQFSLRIPRASTRPKKGKRPARKKRPARTATMELRYAPVQISAPQQGLNQHKEPVGLWLIHLWEPNPPQGEKPVEWFLLTSLNLEDEEVAVRCVRWYCLRWRIEDWHRVIKSGCRAEDHAHHTAERLRRALAVDLVVAWRIMLMSLLGREQPELPADVLFSELELEVLAHHAKKKACAHHTTWAPRSSPLPASVDT